MSALNENHRRHLVTTFKYLDDLLSEALTATARTGSALQRYIPDIVPAQRKALEDQLHHMRLSMAEILVRAGIPLPEPTISARWGLRTALVSARIEVEEIRPQHLRGYGEVTGADAQLLEEASSELFDQLDRMNAYLTEPQTADLQEVVNAWADTQEGAAHVLAPLLMVLARVISEREVPYLRAPLNSLLDRAKNIAFEIALFGRVSSGKSSLLDYLLQTDLLPVGVVPVTAFPTRVRYGETAQLKAWFVGQAPAVLPPNAIGELVTEQGNPDNEKHVTRVELELPLPRLQEGIVFVDTPGLGSLALRGATETLAYLPHCDLGLVLVESTLVPEDIRIVDALRRAGAEVMVLLTKADRLSTDDRSLSLEYAKRQLRAELEAEIPVHLISVRGPDAVLCDHWASLVLDSRKRAYQERAAQSLARKADVLSQTLLADLRLKLRGRNNGDSQKPGDAEPVRRLLTHLEQAERRRANDLELIAHTVARALEAASEESIAGTLDSEKLRKSLEGAFREAISGLGDDVNKSVKELRSELVALTADNSTFGARLADLPKIAGMPVPEAISLPAAFSVHLGIRRWRGKQGRQEAILKQLESHYGTDLQAAVREYAGRLEAWRMEQLRKIRSSLHTIADLLAPSRHNTYADPVDPEALRRDIDELIEAHDAVFISGALRAENVSTNGKASG